jgi:hypothetical protein
MHKVQKGKMEKHILFFWKSTKLIAFFLYVSFHARTII